MPLRRIALLTLFAFGCATVRIPVTAASEAADGVGTIAPPITELWLESSGDIPDEVALAADAQARDAMASALSAREIPATAAGATDAVLFVRERAVGVTSERRSQQTWAKVGIVVGIVVVAIAAVYLATRGGKGSSSTSSGKSASAPRTATPVSVKPRPAPAAPVGRIPGPVTPRPVIGAGPVPRGWNTSPFYFGFYFNFWIPPRPLVLAPEETEDEDPWSPPPGPPAPLALDAFPPSGPPEATADVAEPPPPEPLAAIALQLPPLSDKVSFSVDDRGFFDGTRTAVQLDLIDRASGRLLWSNAVSSGADPLDAGDVTKLVDEALAGVSWARRSR